MTDRNISIEGVQSMLAEETADVVLALLKISHADITEDILLVNDMVDLDFDEGFGEGLKTWVALPFEINLPADAEGKMPTVQLKVDNVHRSIVESIRVISTPPDVELNIVRVDTSGGITREIGPMLFRLNNAEYNATEVTGSLGFNADYLNEPAIQHHFDPVSFPGLFG